MRTSIEIYLGVVLFFIGGGGLAAENAWLIPVYFGALLLVAALPFIYCWIYTTRPVKHIIRKFNRRRRARKYGKPGMTDDEEFIIKCVDLGQTYPIWNDELFKKLDDWSLKHAYEKDRTTWPIVYNHEKKFSRLLREYVALGWIKKLEYGAE